MAYHKSMADLYHRLKAIGFGRAFVQTAILPDWWEDDCADVPFNRGLAELNISRQLGISLASLRNPTEVLTLPAIPKVCLKTATIGTTDLQVQPAILVARRFALQLVRACGELPQFAGTMTAQATRNQLLTYGTGAVDLSLLLRFCWERGIVVAHLEHLPAGDKFRKFDGLVLFIGDRPCILLAEKNDAPAKLAFYLAHEIGHLLLGHLGPGDTVYCDDNIERNIIDEEETQADRFALELLTGRPDPHLDQVYGMTAPKLARAATRYGIRHQIDPAIVAMIYGKCAERMGAAVAALKHLGVDTGARSLIQGQLSGQIDLDRLTESDRRFVEALALPQHSVA